MADLNHFDVIGRLTRDATLQHLGQKATALMTFTIANNTGWGDYAKTNYFDCKWFGAGAEATKQWMMKGKQVAISGTVETENWSDKDTGLPRSKQVINVSSCQLLGDGKAQQGTNAPNPKQPEGDWSGDQGQNEDWTQ